MKTKHQNFNNKSIVHPLTQKSRFGWIPIIVVVIITTNLILSFNLQGKVNSLIVNKPYIYLQKIDGEVAVAQSVDPLYRSETVVQTFVEDWLTLAYTWNIQKPKMFVSENKVNYPLPLYSASMAIVPEYREAYLASISQKYSDRFPFENYIAGKAQSYVRVFQKPIVRKVEEGVWDVTIIAFRTHATGESILDQENFNHEIRVRAINPGNGRQVSQKDTFIQQAIKRMQNKGLQIIDINSI